MKRRVLELACGLGLLAAGATLFVERSGPPPAAPIAVVPREGLPSPRAGSPSADGSAAPAASAAAADPSSATTWSRRLMREDELLVQQAVAAGCDAERAAKLRELLAKKREHRQKTIAEHEAGKITEAEMQLSAHAAKREFTEAAGKLLRPDELEALDPVGARAQVLLEEKQPR